MTKEEMTLPPLPGPSLFQSTVGGFAVEAFTEMQMRSYAAAAVAAGLEQKPVAWLVMDESGSAIHAASWRDAAHEHINDAINDHDLECARKWRVVPVYTHPPRQPNAWRDTVDDMLSVCHEVASDDPRESVDRLINWHVAVMMNPAVSSAAQSLVEDGAAAEREACARMCEVQAAHSGVAHTGRVLAGMAAKIRARSGAQAPAVGAVGTVDVGDVEGT